MRPCLLLLAAVLALAGCEAAPRTAPPPAALPQAADSGGFDSCGASADSVVLSERGIGGTGIDSTGIGGTGIGGTGTGASLADRGIGGTGISPGGIGGTGLTTRGLTHGHAAGSGTGIVGVVGGLPDLCVDGLRIALDRPARITVDGEARTSETLRAGQVASVEASGPADALHAVRIDISHEVAGPVTALAPGGDSVEVMGQHVLLSARTRLAADLHLGGWVSVSGLRDSEGAIHASRVDSRAPGDAVLAGVPALVDGFWQIRGVKLAMPTGVLPSGQRALVSGAYEGGTLHVAEFAEDPLVRADGSLRRLVVEGYPVVAGNKVAIGGGIEADIGPAFGQTPPAGTLIVLELDSSPGALVALSWHEARSGGGHSLAPVAPNSLLQPAAVPATAVAAATATVAAASAAATGSTQPAAAAEAPSQPPTPGGFTIATPPANGPTSGSTAGPSASPTAGSVSAGSVGATAPAQPATAAPAPPAPSAAPVAPHMPNTFPRSPPVAPPTTGAASHGAGTTTATPSNSAGGSPAGQSVANSSVPSGSVPTGSVPTASGANGAATGGAASSTGVAVGTTGASATGGSATGGSVVGVGPTAPSGGDPGKGTRGGSKIAKGLTGRGGIAPAAPSGGRHL